MYGQQIGKLEQPLENVVLEEYKGENNEREVIVAISMKDLAATKPIAEHVNRHASKNTGIEAIFVDSPSSPLNFKKSFDDYLNQVAKLGPGKSLPLVDYDFLKLHMGLVPVPRDIKAYFGGSMGVAMTKYGIYCLGTNRFVNPATQLELWYLLNRHDSIESSFSVSQFKNIGHPKVSLGRQGVMGYFLKGSDDLIDMTKSEIVAAASEQPASQRGILTLNDVAYMKEALLEFRYQAIKLRGQGYGRSVPTIISREPTRKM